MVILNDFSTTVRKALEEIDPKYDSYNGLIICGTHTPHNIEEIIGEIKKARESMTPTLGICFGMQLMAIEYARNVLDIKDATSEEFGSEGTFVVKRLPRLRVGLKDLSELGFYSNIYGWVSKEQLINTVLGDESHWHNYYVDTTYFKTNKNKDWGIGILTKSDNNIDIPEYMGIIRREPPHFSFAGVQFHPEYQSSKEKPHPLLVKFLNLCRK